MTYRWLTDLDQALAAYGVPYVEVMDWPTDYVGTGDWRTRGRPHSTGQFDPRGILCHHTASPPGTSDEADLNAILWGNGSAPGPISQLYIGRTGTVYLVGAGRANHGGQGIRPGVDVHGCADMNAALLGIEAGNAGTGAERWSDELVNAYADVVVALAKWYGWRRGDVYLHATTGPPGGGCNSKIDPAGPWIGQPDIGGSTWNLDVWLDYVVDRATGGGGGDLPIGGEVTPEDIEAIAQRVWSIDLHNYKSGEAQGAQFLLGFAHAEAFDGSWKREAANMMTGDARTLDDLVRFAHYEAATANAKCDRIIAALEAAGMTVPGD